MISKIFTTYVRKNRVGYRRRGGVLWSGVNNLKWSESSYVLFNTHSNASHSNSRELFVVGGHHIHTRGPGLFAGDRYLGILHRQCHQTPLIVQSGSFKFQWQVSIILAMTPINAPFSKAAATRSLSASCLLTSSPVLCVPSLIRTSIRNLEGRDCSKRTRTPRPMTVARLQ